MIERVQAGNCGCTFVLIGKGVPRIPEARRTPAPESAVPIAKCVAVGVAHPVEIGNCSRLAFVNVEPASVQSEALVRATRA